VVKPSPYLDPQNLAKLQGLDLVARLAVEGYVSGLHKSPYHGFSVEFAEHREYSPGDDIRHVDWKVWSKTDRLYLKLYEEETNLLTYLMLDTSQSMDYASEGNVTKLHYAKMIAACLSYLVLHQSDSIGLSTFDSRVTRVLRPSGQASQLKEVISMMDRSPGGEKTDLSRVFHDLAERAKRRGLVVVLSDLFEDPERVVSGLKHFRHRRHDVVVMHILDPAELTFPFRGTTDFRGLEELGNVVIDPLTIRKAYQEEFGKFVETIRRGCRVSNIDYLQLTTDQNLAMPISNYLRARQGGGIVS
jgi:uncharacterized protein (DUF58 family)